ncbi:MAG: MarR family winged helix-turn-helix transcriptional regulator [Dehalococcoidales bacterium]|nr:MarR family winged helix-turn-helix transcriptional regulator [Dehalococcoidales bacterium]
MPVKFGFDNPTLRTWLLIHQTYNLVLKAEESLFKQIGISPQYNGVLMAMRYTDGPVTATIIANWLDRNNNAISMLLDRMQRDGLIRRVRSSRDRREVRLVLTSKGREIIEKATELGWRLIQDILGEIPEEDLRALIDRLEEIRGRTFEVLNPGRPIEEAKITKGAGEMPAQ